MRTAIAIFVLSTGAFVAASVHLGFREAYLIAYGAVVAMAMSISATFFWLWARRATPLALGMGFSWAGTTGVLGWWWAYHILAAPMQMEDNAALFAFVAAYFVGAVLHFRVVGRSLGGRTLFLLIPLVVVTAVTVLAIR